MAAQGECMVIFPLRCGPGLARDLSSGVALPRPSLPIRRYSFRVEHRSRPADPFGPVPLIKGSMFDTGVSGSPPRTLVLLVNAALAHSYAHSHIQFFSPPESRMTHVSSQKTRDSMASSDPTDSIRVLASPSFPASEVLSLLNAGRSQDFAAEGSRIFSTYTSHYRASLVDRSRLHGLVPTGQRVTNVTLELDGNGPHSSLVDIPFVPPTEEHSLVLPPQIRGARLVSYRATGPDGTGDYAYNACTNGSCRRTQQVLIKETLKATPQQARRWKDSSAGAAGTSYQPGPYLPWSKQQ